MVTRRHPWPTVILLLNPFSRRAATPVIETKSDLTDPEPWLEAAFGGGKAVDGWHVSAALACVSLKSEAVASLDLNLVKRDATAEPVNHPAIDLLRGQVNPWLDGYSFFRDIVAQMQTNDAGGIAVAVFGSDNRLLEIIHYASNRITVEYDPSGTGEPTYRLDGRILDSRRIIHLRDVTSKCRMTLAADAIATAKKMELHCRNLFANAARPGGIIEMEKSLGDKALGKMRDSWRAAFGGAQNAGKTAILWDGASYKQLALTSTDAQLLELRRFAVEEIARAFSVPVSMIGDLTRSSFANAEQRQKEFLSYTLEPILRSLEAALNRGLLNDEERRTLTFRFDRDDISRVDLQTRALAINSLRASEVLSADEGRDWLGLPKRTDGKGDDYSNPNITLKKPATVPANA